MTQRRAWALIGLAVCALVATPWAPAAAAVAVAALGALVGLAALAQRDTLREGRVAALEAKLIKLEADSTRTAEMWRVYQSGA